MRIPRFIQTSLGAVLLPAVLHSADNSPATTAINTLGIELLAQTHSPNALLSPYSIQNALAMTYAGADGSTRTEMAKVLHFPEDGLDASFMALNSDLAQIGENTKIAVDRSKQHGGPAEPVTIQIANRLFGQESFEFRPAFLDLVKNDYHAPLEPLNFAQHPDQATQKINSWVEEATHQRIRDLIPKDALDQTTRLVLVNAIYLKAAWAQEFAKSATQPAAFLTGGTTDVPTMHLTSRLGYAKRNGYTAVTLPYIGGDLQFLILLPDQPNGLPGLEAKLDATALSGCAALEPHKIILSLPKFKMEPPTLALSAALQSLGMKSAFDIPPRSANFDRMAQRTPDRYLYISQVFHKTFLSLDENGTEAAAATAVAMMMMSAMPAPEPPPIEVRVDHPFLFAIQHRSSGACLFLGRMTDPTQSKGQ